MEMLYTYTQWTNVSVEDTEEIRHLHQRCNAHDKLESDVFLDPSLNVFKDMPFCFGLRDGKALIAFLTLFTPTKEESEVTAFTDPSYRGQGCFHILLGKAEEACSAHHIRSLLFAIDSKSTEGLRTASHLEHTNHTFSEFRMKREAIQPDLPQSELSFVQVTSETADLYREVLSSSEKHEDFSTYMQATLEEPQRAGWIATLQGKPIGMYHLNKEEGGTCIYGVEILKTERGKGYGRILLGHAVHQACLLGAPILLDVDCTNAIALHLYTTLGFKVVYETAYYQTDLM